MRDNKVPPLMLYLILLGDLLIKIKLLISTLSIPLAIVIAFFVLEPRTQLSAHQSPANTPAIRSMNFGGKTEGTLFVIGDVGTGSQNQKKVAEAMEKRCQMLTEPLLGLILLGDNFYQAGVESTADPQWQEIIFDTYGTPCLKKANIYPILGNHDYKGNIEAQVAMSELAPRWKMIDRFYEVIAGNTFRLIAIDTNGFDYCMSAKDCSLQYLRQQLETSQSFQWTIVMGHHPIFQTSEKYQKPEFIAAELKASFLREILCERADIYLAGHVHLMEYIPDNPCQLAHFISGAGGADLYDLGDPEYLEGFTSQTHGYLELFINQEKIKAKIRDTANNIIFAKTLTKS